MTLPRPPTGKRALPRPPRNPPRAKNYLGGLDRDTRRALAIRCRAECLAAQRLCLNIFSRAEIGAFQRRDGLADARARVWEAMRAWRTKVGMATVALSFPEIAWATGAPNHSTVITAIKKRAERGSGLVADIQPRGG